MQKAGKDDLLGLGSCQQIKVLGGIAQQQVAHRSTHQVGIMPCTCIAVDCTVHCPLWAFDFSNTPLMLIWHVKQEAA